MRTVIAWVLLALVLGCQSQEERFGEYEQSAASYIENEEWSEAKIELLNMIQIDPEHAETRFKLGVTLFQLQEYGDALWQYGEAVRLEPENLEWRGDLASLQLAARQLDDAREQVDYILEHDPDDVEALLQRARLLGQEGEIDAMLAGIDRVLELDPEHQAGLIFRSRALSSLKRFDEAEKTLDRLIEVEESVRHLVLKAGFLVSRGRADESEGLFRRAIEIAEKPENRRASRLALANLLMNQGKLDEAEQELLAAREQAEDADELLAALARFYLVSNQPEKAESLLEERALAHPDEAGPLIGLARFQRRLGERERAVKSVERAIEVAPDNQEAQVLRAEFLLEDSANDPALRAEAERIVEAVLEQNPASLRAQFTQAKIMLVDRRFEDASVLLRRVLEEQPDANSYFLLGTAYLGMGQKDLARAELLSCLQQDASHVVARTQLAALYLDSGNPELAAQEARRGLGVAKGDHRLSLILARALVQLRAADEAGEMLDAMPLTTPEVRTPLRLRAAVIYLDLARFGRAREIVTSVLEEEPTSMEGLRSAILVESRAGRPNAALPLLSAALEAKSDDPALYRLRGAYYLGFRRSSDGAPRYPNQAQADLLRAEQLEPKSSATQVLLGQLRESVGNDREALEAFDRAIEFDPGNGDAYMRKGALLERQLQLEGAVENYRALLELPGHGSVSQRALAVAMNNLAWLLVDREEPSPSDLDRALELAQDAKELLPDDPSVADTLGWVMYKRAIPGAAITLFREAIASYEPGSPPRALTRYHLALSYEANGEPQRAIEELGMALEESQTFPDRENAELALKRLNAS